MDFMVVFCMLLFVPLGPLYVIQLWSSIFFKGHHHSPHPPVHSVRRTAADPAGIPGLKPIQGFGRVFTGKVGHRERQHFAEDVRISAVSWFFTSEGFNLPCFKVFPSRFCSHFDSPSWIQKVLLGPKDRTSQAAQHSGGTPIECRPGGWGVDGWGVWRLGDTKSWKFNFACLGMFFFGNYWKDPIQASLKRFSSGWYSDLGFAFWYCSGQGDTIAPADLQPVLFCFSAFSVPWKESLSHGNSSCVCASVCIFLIVTSLWSL